uniref:Uncharacterized protein n=1 Tax=Rhizophora mucronata TaxID=61149 RepID=A0A2P2Q974_RHIMU
MTKVPGALMHHFNTVSSPPNEYAIKDQNSFTTTIEKVINLQSNSSQMSNFDNIFPLAIPNKPLIH